MATQIPNPMTAKTAALDFSSLVPTASGAGYGNNGQNGSMFQNLKSNVFGSNSNEGMFGDMFGDNGWQNLGAGVGAAKDLFSIYAQMQGMDMAKTSLNNQNKVNNYNMANNTNFTNGTIDVFGSGQAKSQNQFGSAV